jgi:glycerol-3-phosphate dehydrogenase
MPVIYDLIIIGGGVVGCAIAREASKYKLKTALFEKEPDVAEGISKANSGVLHAGFNARPGSLKARFNVDGLKLCSPLAEELDVEYRITGKLVVGKTDEDLPYLRKLLEQGEANECSGLSIIGEKQIRSIQSGIEAKWALSSSSTGIISPLQFTVALAENAAENGVEFRLNSAVTGITALTGGGFRVTTSDGHTADCCRLVNSTGMYGGDVKSLIETHDRKTYPCRGEYYITDKEDGKLLNLPIYPVPPTDGSGLGVHLTPTCNGNILIGPSADYIDESDDTATTADVMTQLKKEAAELLPSLKNSAFIKNYAGMRPKLFNKNSEVNFADFIIEESEQFPGMINLIGIESPGLTSAPAIAVHVIENLIGTSMDLVPNKSFIPERRGIPRTSRLSDAELSTLIAEDPDYGEIICRCEHISRAEILRAINNPIGARSLNAIKKRTYSMMGRCQSGFCLPKIIAILCEELGRRPEEIIKFSEDSAMLTGWIK